MLPRHWTVRALCLCATAAILAITYLTFDHTVNPIAARADSVAGPDPAHNNVQHIPDPQQEIASLQQKLTNVTNENMILEEKNTSLTSEYKKIQVSLSSGEGDQIPGPDAPNDRQSSEIPTARELSKLQKQIGELKFYRQLQIYNYKTAEYHSFHWDIPYALYSSYRGNPSLHNIPTTGGAMTLQYYEDALSSWEDLRNLAEGLRNYSGDDDELYANFVMQVTHQFLFVPTEYTKHPIETFVEGSGDCDSLAVFAASLMKAGGLESAIVYGKATDHDGRIIGHALVGVILGDEPNDHSRKAPSYMIDENDDKYYLAEATWQSGVFSKPWDYTRDGSAVGDMIWQKFSGDIVRTPDY
ncbi:MAG: hypothetical protein MN733_06030 [Nitrososphaera sp.]|nr:hypothetical protein [Nitrososphaera sp.]